MVSWQQPNEGFIKLNVNESFFGNPGCTNFGGLIRNNNGSWLVGLFGYVGVGSNLLLKLLSIKFGLQLAWDRGLTKVICDLDSMDSLRLIQEDSIGFHKFSAIITEIKDFLSRF